MSTGNLTAFCRTCSQQQLLDTCGSCIFSHRYPPPSKKNGDTRTKTKAKKHSANDASRWHLATLFCHFWIRFMHFVVTVFLCVGLYLSMCLWIWRINLTPTHKQWHNDLIVYLMPLNNTPSPPPFPKSVPNWKFADFQNFRYTAKLMPTDTINRLQFPF